MLKRKRTDEVCIWRTKLSWTLGMAGKIREQSGQGRNEKDDTLKLTLAVGEILENNGFGRGVYQNDGRLSDAL